MATKAKAGWQKQESRSVRPFRSAEDYLKEVGLQMYPDEEFGLAEAIQTSAVEVDKLALAIRVPGAPPNLEELVGVPAKLLRLVVTVEDRMFKDSGVAFNVPLIELGEGPRVLDIEKEVIDRMSWAGETRIHVAVILAEQRLGEVGTAQRAGSWVAKKTFVIGRPRDTASFTINAVDPEYFEQRGLPAGTTYLIEITDPDLNQPCENLPDLVKVSLSKDVHAALARDEDSLLGKAFVKCIYVDVVTTVLSTGYASLVDDVQADSIIDVVTTKLAKSTGISPERLRSLAKETAGSQLRAVVQADIELSRALVSAAQRRIA